LDRGESVEAALEPLDEALTVRQRGGRASRRWHESSRRPWGLSAGPSGAVNPEISVSGFVKSLFLRRCPPPPWPRRAAARSGGAPVRAIEAVDERGVTEQLGLAAQGLAETFSHADRGIVARADEADEVVAAQLGEGIGHRAARAFGGVAVAPRL